MAKTSSISLFAPLPPKAAASPNAGVSLATDSSSTLSKTGSFEQTLKSAQKPKASKTDDAQTPSKAEKPASKKPGKASKPKASRSTGAKRQADSSAGEVDHSDAEATQASDTESAPTADESPADAKGDAAKKDESASTEATTPDPTMAAAAAASQSPVAPKQPDADQKGEADSATNSVAQVQQGQSTGQAAKIDEDGDGNTEAAAGDVDPTTQAAAEAQKSAASVSHAASTHTTGVALGTAKVKSGGLVEDGQDGSAAGADVAAAAATTSQVASSDAATTDIADAIQSLTDAIGGSEESSSPPSHHATDETDGSTNLSPFEQALQRTVGTTAAKAPPAASVPAEAQFTEANHPAILNGIHTQLLPNGGTMQIRLDPPELGALQVTVHMRDGVMTASFETSNDDATQMLSHSLNDLKTMLEAGGVNVERMHVQQAPRPESHSNGSDQQQQRGSEQQHEARQEQQRRELLQRMWRKLAGGADPLDLVA